MGWTVYDSSGNLLSSIALVDNVVATAKIADDAVTYAKLQNLGTANRVLGSASTGLIGEVEVATNMIANDAVTYVKMQDLATADRVLGSESTGVIGEVQIVADMIATDAVTTVKIANDQVTGAKLNPALVAGDIIYADGTDTITRLEKPGTPAGEVLTFAASATAPSWAAAAGGPTQANQAALEAETNQDTYAPPDLIKHSPGVAKAWCDIANNGTISGSTSYPNSYNIAGIDDDGIGNRDINFDVDFSQAVYAIAGVITANHTETSLNFHTFGVGDVGLATFNPNGGALSDAPSGQAFFGDQ